MAHISVLSKEIIEGLNLGVNDLVVDATLGSAGHSLEICKAFPGIRIVGIDQDQERAKYSAKKLLDAKCNGEVVEENFRNIKKALGGLGIKKVNKVLFDLGLNSEQLENSGRGFSFQKDEPLLMTFSDEHAKFTAKEIVNDWKEENIADVIYGYGGERFSRQIASEIVKARGEASIETTKDLVEIIEKAVPDWYKTKKIHFATKTFQALRITANDELGALKEGLKESFEVLERGGRIAVISFHALEDRIVKKYFREQKDRGEVNILTKKPITPSRDEVKENPRSRSAKLRIIEKK